MGSNVWRNGDGSQLPFLRCAHTRKTSVTSVASTDWSRTEHLRRRSLEIEGVSCERCIDCGAVRLREPASDEQLDAAFQQLDRAIPGPDALRIAAPTSVARRSPQLPSAPPSPQPYRARRAEIGLSEVVLPARTRTQLDEALAKLANHQLIYEEWGFSEIDRVGRAATLCLFGPPGTGKTRAAEALAGELGAPFLPIAAADVESRFLGDSAKNVRAIFAAATEQGAVLFFDEADSLFGRRASDVTQGVDHEVNLTKSTLLVEVERFAGVLVLATNFERNLDPAFRRRLSWIVEFAKPDRAARQALWELHIPAKVPLAAARDEIVEHAVSASDGLTGGDILTAMRLALAAVAHEAGVQGRLGAPHLSNACDSVARGEASLQGARRSASQVRSLLVGPVSDRTKVESEAIPSDGKGS